MSAGHPEHGSVVLRMRLIVLLVLGGGALVLLVLLLYPFLPALVTSAVLASLSFPAHRRLLRFIRQEDLAAFFTTTAVFFLVLLPMVGLSLILIDQVRQGVDWLGGVIEDLTAPGGLVTRALDYVSGSLGVEAGEVMLPVTDELSGLVGLLARRTFTFLSGLGGWLLQGGAAIFTLFYFLRDAERLMGIVKWLIPLNPETTEELIRKTRDVIYATVFGNVAVAVVQGTLGGLAFWMLGLPASALWGSVMGILSLLPLVGPALVWLPGGLILLAGGEVLRGVLLLGFGTAVISTVDNYLRAVLIGGRAQLHSLLVFFSVLAGLFAFGAVGIFIGPVLFVIALSLLEIARAALDTPVESAAGAPGPDARVAQQFGMFLAGPVRPRQRAWSRLRRARRSAAASTDDTGSATGRSGGEAASGPDEDASGPAEAATGSREKRVEGSPEDRARSDDASRPGSS